MMKIGVFSSRPTGRLSFFAAVFLWAWLAPFLHAAQPATTVISDVVYRANGTPALGTLLISWPAFVTAERKSVAAGSLSVTLGAGGALNVALVPNQGATPAGTYYKVTLKLDDGTTNSENWVVPATSPVTVADVRATVVPAAQAGQYATVGYVDSQNAAQDTVTGTKLGRQGDTPVTLASVRYASQFANIQAAVNDAGTTGAVLIPSNYAGTDSYANAARVPVLDFRQGRLTVSDLAMQGPCADVRAFGAKGDGAADDTSAVQAWINAIPDGGCGFVPPGSFRMKVSSTLRIYLRQKMRFYSPSGQGSSADCQTSGFYWAGANDGTLLDINRSRGLVVEGLAFCGWISGSSTRAGKLVNVDQSISGLVITSDIVFQRDYFSTMSRSGARLLSISDVSTENVEDIRVHNSTFIGNFDHPPAPLTDCVTIGASSNAKNEEFSQHNFFSNCRNAITVANGSFRVRDNEFTTNGVDLKLSGAWVEPSEFCGNVSEFSKQAIDAGSGGGSPLEICRNKMSAGGADLTKTFTIMPLSGLVNFHDNQWDWASDANGCPDPALKLLGFPANNQTLVRFYGNTLLKASCYNLDTDLEDAAMVVDDVSNSGQSNANAGGVTTLGGQVSSDSNGGRLQARWTNGLRRPIVGINLDANTPQLLGGVPCAIDGTSTCFDQGGIEVVSVMQPWPNCSVAGAGGGTARKFALVARDASGNRAMMRYRVCPAPATYSSSNYVALSWPAAPGASSYDILAANPLDGSQWVLVANTTSTNFNVTSNPSGPYVYSRPAYNETTVVKVRGVTQPVAQATPAANPPAGQFFLYVKSGTGLCEKDSSGAETCFGSGGGGGATDWNNPGTIGATTANTGRFTRLTLTQDGDASNPALTLKNGGGIYSSGANLGFIVPSGGCQFYQYAGGSSSDTKFCDAQSTFPVGTYLNPGLSFTTTDYGLYKAGHAVGVTAQDADGAFYVTINGTNVGFVDASGFHGAVVGNVTGNVSGSAGSVAWSGISGTPTTIAGYGLTDALKSTNNLNDVSNAGTARTNLGLGTSATKDVYGSSPGTKLASTSLGSDPATDNCVKWIAGGKLGDAGAPCGSGGGSVASVFGRTGTVAAQSGDYTAAQVTNALDMSATRSANTVLAGPSSGAAAAPTFRALVSADIPNNAANTTGNAATATALAANGSNCTGNNFALGVDAGGNGECAQPAFSNLSGAIASSQQNNPAVGAKGGVEAKACSGTDKLSAIGSDGVPVCSADQTGGGSSPTQAKTALLDCVPDTTGNVFYTVVALTAWRDGHWEWDKANAVKDLYCKIKVPHNVAATPNAKIVLSFAVNDGTAGHTMTFKTCDADVGSGSINPGSLTCAATQSITTTSTAYARLSLTFSVQSTVAADDLLIVQIEATASSGNLANNVIMDEAYFQFDGTL